MQKWLDTGALMYSRYNESKSEATGRFTRFLKDKTYKKNDT